MRTRIAIAVAAIATTALGCAQEHRPVTAFERFVTAVGPGRWRATGTVRVEVWVCRVPAGSSNPDFGGLPLRRDLTPDRVTSAVARRVPDYFTAISGGALDMEVVAGATVDLAAGEGAEQCAAHALDRSGTDTAVVLAVADAEQAPGRQGGYGSGGVAVDAKSPARASRRWAYVGASDFSPDWGDEPPMDLVEHELGHTLGWVHSGTDEGPPAVYRSALDVMSDSAAPRATDPSRRDAPDTLGLDRVIAGWLPAARVVEARAARTVPLTPALGGTGAALLVLPVDDRTFLTVELLMATGYDDHLPTDGVVIHRVVLGDDGLPTSVEPLTVAGSPLRGAGSSDTVAGWRIDVAAGWSVTVAPKN